ncbi:MAG: formimidoylglutamate deiminase, partial [Betaproteobacteria bacterium]
MPEHSLWAAQAWIDGRWQASVLLDIDAQGRWSTISADVTNPPAHARRLAGPVLPGLVDAHSHAFQRSFAGLSERRESESDDFWSWRERMYRVALRITPAQMRAIAAQLYVELLRGGYTQVCEFHYLHHGVSGKPYSDPATMSWVLADAAQDAGIGMTLLPVLYQRAGFTQDALRDDQRRFAGSPAMVHDLCSSLQSSRRPNINAGVALHSLRAAGQPAIRELMQLVGDADMPIHIHVAEQTAEVDDCLKATGKRPIAYLCEELAPDARWQLIHATHATASEIDAVRRSGAGIVICPATEANLGDGLTDLALWLDAGVPMAIGSDSHVVRNWPEELRWLEYGQRLVHRKRNVAAAPGRQSATAARLFDAALVAGGTAAGQAAWGLVCGARADALVLDASAPALRGIPASHQLDALVFASGEPALSEVIV